MSLINNMLSGLERRRMESGDDHRDPVFGELSAVEDDELIARGNSGGVWVWAALLLVLFAVVLYFAGAVRPLYVPLPGPEVAGVDDPQRAAMVNGGIEDGRPAVSEESHPMPQGLPAGDGFSLKLDAGLTNTETGNTGVADSGIVNISDIRIHQSNEDMNLGLSLPVETKYLIYTLKDPFRMVLELDNARYEGSLPDISELKSISAIRQRQEEDGTYKLVLESDHEIQINQSALEDSDEGYSLNIEMARSSEFRTTANTGDSGKPVTDTETTGKFSKSPVKTDGTISRREFSSSASQVEMLIYDGRKLYEEGKVKQGLEKIIQAVEKEPGHVRARTTLAMLLLEQDEKAAASEILVEGLRNKPDQSEWAKVLGRILYNNGNLEQARTVLEGASPPLSSDPEYHALYAGVLQSMESHARAAIVYRNLLKHAGNNGSWWLGLAISLEAMARNSDAAIAYKNALNAKEIQPDSAEFIKNRLRNLNQQS